MNKDILMTLDRINAILTDFCSQEDLGTIEKNGNEENVDLRVFNLMETMYPDNKIVVQNLKNEEVYSYLKSKRKSGKKGRSDITLFNYYNTRSIELLIENKFDKEKGNPIDEAIKYCENINSSGKFVCRIAIGFNPFDTCQIITKVLSSEGTWNNLVINGKTINGFIGQEILQLIYSNPGVTTFTLLKKEEETYTRNEFRKILDSDLPTLFRNMSDIANKHFLKISFVVAYISLKIILEKQEAIGDPVKDEANKIVIWRNNDLPVDPNCNTLRSVADIKSAVNAIAGTTAKKELQDKYKYIFCLEENLTFNDLLDKIRTTETKNNISQVNSSINKMKVILDKIKNQAEYKYEFDLFGEVYESLADDKTKAELGQYFTKRHIIRPIVNMLLKPSDLEAIINNHKTICDPFCGTGGMLTESFKHIRNYCNEKYPEKNTSEIANKVIFGYDIIDINISKTKINMTLAEDGYSVIEVRDSLSTLQEENKFDYIITNVPYGAGYTEGIVTNLNDVKTVNSIQDRDIVINRIKNFEKQNNTKKLEYNALIKVVQILKEGGKAMVIIPDGILENPTFSKLREWFLVKCKIETIISLPRYAFAPYTKEKTYAVIFQKRKTTNKEELIETINDIDVDEKFYAYIVDNDGYANSDKQYETNLKNEDGKPLHNELANYIDVHGEFHASIIEQICRARQEDNDEHYNEWGEKIEGKKYGYIYIRDILSAFYYKSEEEKESNKVYSLNLLPEKYFRPTKFENLDYQKLKEMRISIENDIKHIIGEIS